MTERFFYTPGRFTIILEHDFFIVKNYLEVHLVRTNLELVTCGVLALEEKINLQSTTNKVNMTAEEKRKPGP